MDGDSRAIGISSPSAAMPTAEQVRDWTPTYIHLIEVQIPFYVVITGLSLDEVMGSAVRAF